MIEKKVATPIDLSAFKNSGIPDVVPSGFEVLDNVPLQIDGMICLWGAGGTNRGMEFPEQVVGIPVNQTFQTLYIYHGSYFGSQPGTPVFQVVFRYADGSSATNQLCYGTDILDWYAPKGQKVRGPSGRNSKVAWIGEMERQNGKQQLRHCMTAMENPEPARNVESIDLFSCKSRTVPCIMAMTVGKTNLMKASEVVDDREN